MQALEYFYCEEVTHVNEYIEIEDEEWELDCDPADTTEYPAQDFVTRSKLQRMITAEMGKSPAHCKDPVLTGLAEDTLFEALQMRYDAAKEGIITVLSNQVGEVIVDTIQLGKLDSRPMRDSEALTQSGRIVNASTRPLAGCKLPITTMKGLV